MYFTTPFQTRGSSSLLPPFSTAALIVLLRLPLPVVAQSLPDATVALVGARLQEAARASWELGTRVQTILELNATIYSVVTPHTPVPPPSHPAASYVLSNALDPVFNITNDVVANRSSSNGNITGPQPLIQDGSAADPASVGVAVLLADCLGRRDYDYRQAAKDQLDFLLGKVPRTQDGAISHRVSQVQLWSDFVYMVPPFLAYYGVVTKNQSLLTEAYNQIKLYRSHLRDEGANNLWKHVLLGSDGNDEGHWSTGNAWAAAGILRVLGTIQNSQYAHSMKDQQKDLADWVLEIHSGMYPLLDKDKNLFLNYASRPSNATGNFYDAASTALLASTVYRLSLLWGIHTHLPDAERSRKALSATNGTTFSPPDFKNVTTFVHFDKDGWLSPVVNPHSYGEEGQKSAEGQAFALQMHAAWRDWVAGGAKGKNGTTSTRAQRDVRTWWACILFTMWMCFF